MSHVPRLSAELRHLLRSQRVAALGTTNSDGYPFVSMVPFAIEEQSHRVVIHISGLAAHTRNLQTQGRVSLLVMQSEVVGEPVHALPRVTLDGLAIVPDRTDPHWMACKTAYLSRFPQAQQMTALGDFMFVSIAVDGARHVAGFGAARTLDQSEIDLVLGAQ